MRLLFILSSVNKSLLKDLISADYEARVVFWAKDGIDLVALEQVVSWADEVVVEDDIASEVGDHLGVRPGLLSKSRLVPMAVARFKSLAIAGPHHGRVNHGDAAFLDGPILFCPSNDTHVRMFEPICRHLDRFCFVTAPQRHERADELLSQLGFEYVSNQPGIVRRLRPSLIVLGCDWSPEAWQLIGEGWQLSVPSVCIQEGCLDWGKPSRRMERSDFPFVQGPFTLQHLDQVGYFMTGNPRFDDIKRLPLPGKPLVMINSNFTYGIFEEAREMWIRDVVSACRGLGLDFFISQHPRERANLGDLPVRPSSASVVHQHLAECSILITRFSTLVYEALLMGRPVIYYNPHGESMRTFNDDTTGGIHKAYGYGELTGAIQAAIQQSGQWEAARRSFLQLHCGAHDGRAAERCAAALLHLRRVKAEPFRRLQLPRVGRSRRTIPKRILGRLSRMTREFLCKERG